MKKPRIYAVKGRAPTVRETALRLGFTDSSAGSVVAFAGRTVRAVLAGMQKRRRVR
jgi:hypothetical protein